MSKHEIKIRRKDREKGDVGFFRMMVTHCPSCSIAYVDSEVPANHVAFFVYDENSNEIIFHLSKHGYGGSALTGGKTVCISLYKFGDLYTAAKAVDFGSEYQSVVIYGIAQIEESESEKMRLMKIFFEKFFPKFNGHSFSDFTTVDIKPIYVVRVKVDKWFAKQHRTPEYAMSHFAFPEYFKTFNR